MAIPSRRQRFQRADREKLTLENRLLPNFADGVLTKLHMITRQRPGNCRPHPFHGFAMCSPVWGKWLIRRRKKKMNREFGAIFHRRA